MKVVVITHNYIRREGDLTALYLHRLSSGLVKKGLDITVVCPHAPGLLREDTIDGVRIKRFGFAFSGLKPLVYAGNMHQEVAGSWLARIVFLSFLWSFYRFSLKTCRTEKADLIWANWWAPPGIVAARIAAKFRLPLVISSHGTDISLLSKGGLISRLGRYVYARTSRATVVSTFLKEKLLAAIDVIESGRVEVIPMPVGMENFPRTPPPDNQVPVLLSVARFTSQKRLDDIINAAAQLKAEGLNFKIIMVGEGPLEAELKESVNRHQLDGIIEFVPLVAQQKLGELYRQADAVILSSEAEGFGLVLVEAGLTGRAVVGARSGGITDIISDGENGLLYEVGDIDGLVGCMRTIITDPEFRNRMGESGCRNAHEKFSTAILVDRVYNLFQSVIDDRRKNTAT